MCFHDLDENCYGVLMEKTFLEQVQEKMGRAFVGPPNCLMYFD